MNPMRIFDKEGNEITTEQWHELLEDNEYRVVRRTKIEKNGLEVSTVWLGLDHSHEETNEPIIFETLIWNPESGKDFGGTRAATEKEALVDHEEFVKKAKKIPIEEVVLEEL